MSSTAQLKLQEMVWQYPEKDNQPFVLFEGDSRVGWLQFREEPAASTAEFNGKKWTLRYNVKLHPRVTVCPEDDPQHVVAEFLPCWTGGGWVMFDSGVRYRWRKAHIWGGGWCFIRMDEKSSVCLSQEAGALMAGGKVSICREAAGLPETPVLLLLAWFLRIMDFEMLVEGLFRVG